MILKEENKFEKIRIKSISVVCPHCDNSIPMDEVSEDAMCYMCGLSLEAEK